MVWSCAIIINSFGISYWLLSLRCEGTASTATVPCVMFLRYVFIREEHRNDAENKDTLIIHAVQGT